MAKGKKTVAKASSKQQQQQQPQQDQSAQTLSFSLQNSAGETLAFKVRSDMQFARVWAAYCDKWHFKHDWAVFTFKGKPIAREDTFEQLGMHEGAVVLFSISMEQAARFRADLQRPRPALLITTYGQLENEVHLGAPEFEVPDVYDGSSFKSRQPAKQELSEPVRQALLLMGCGFFVEQVPADLRQALLANDRTPQDLREALQQALDKRAGSATANGKGSSGNFGSSKASSSSGSSSKSGMSVYQRAHTDCSGWAAGFGLVCSASLELSLPLAMHMCLPVPMEQGFRQQVCALDDDSNRLYTMMRAHREFLSDLPEHWGLATLGNRTSEHGCVPALEFEQREWARTTPLPDTALAVDVCALQSSNMAGTWRNSSGSGTGKGAAAQLAAKQPTPALWDIPGTAKRLKKRLQALLGEQWAELPWLIKGGTEGVVLAGGAVQAHMLAGRAGVHDDYNLYIVAPDEATYTRIMADTRSVLTTVTLTQPEQDPVDPKDQASDLMCNIVTFVIRGSSVKLSRWPYCSPLALVCSFDVPSVASWFDGEEVFLDERCAWCHANKLLLADPFFDMASSQRYCVRLYRAAMRLPGYRVLMPGPLSTQDYMALLSGVGGILASAVKALGTIDFQNNIIDLLKELRGLARWVVLHASLMLYGSANTSNQPELFTINGLLGHMDKNTMLCPKSRSRVPDYAVAMEAITDLSAKSWPFSGFFQLPWGGAEPDGLARMGDDATWFSNCELEELPRRVWLAAHCVGLKPQLSAVGGRPVLGQQAAAGAAESADPPGPASDGKSGSPLPMKQSHVPSMGNEEYNNAAIHEDGWSWIKMRMEVGKGPGWSQPRHHYNCSHAGCPAKKMVEGGDGSDVMSTQCQGVHSHARPSNPAE